MLDIPLTVKMRTGIYDKNWNAHKLLPKLRDWGVTMATVRMIIYGDQFCVHNFVIRFTVGLENNGILNLLIMITLWSVQTLPRPCPYLVRHNEAIKIT